MAVSKWRWGALSPPASTSKNLIGPTIMSWSQVGYEGAVRLGLLGVYPLVDLIVPKPFIRQVYGTNWAYYAFPRATHEHVPFTLLVWLGIIIPLLTVVCTILLIYKRNTYIQKYEMIQFVYGFSLAILLNEPLTSLAKRWIGQLRPDYLSRCFNTSNVPLWLSEHQMTLEDIPPIPQCVAGVNQQTLLEGRVSFPSGHSSYSAVTFVYLAAWMWRQLPTQFGIVQIKALRIVITAIILWIPVFVGFSRVSDYRHHATDVLAGLTLGTTIALTCFNVYHGNRVVEQPKQQSWPPQSEDTVRMFPANNNSTNTPSTSAVEVV